jgi:DHA2 family multidrug resistance protein
VPLSTLTFSTLAPRYRNEGTALFGLIRNLGSSIGISVVITYPAQRTQINHAAFAGYLTPFSLPLQQAAARLSAGFPPDDMCHAGSHSPASAAAPARPQPGGI